MFSNDLWLRKRELCGQVFYHIHITRHLLTIYGFIPIVVVLKTLHEHNATRILITEQRNGCIYTLLQVTEAYNISEGLDTIENTVGTAKCLNQPMHFQILIHPQCIQCCSIEARQEHIHHDEQIQFLVLHTKGYVFIIILELIAGRIIVRMEH